MAATTTTIKSYREEQEDKLDTENAIFDEILRTPFVTPDLIPLVVWVIIPQALQIHGHDTNAVKETVRHYLTEVDKLKPLKGNASWWNRLIHHIIQRALVEYNQFYKFPRPMRLQVIRREFPELYVHLMNALSSKQQQQQDDNGQSEEVLEVDKLIAEVDNLAEKHLLV